MLAGTYLSFDYVNWRGEESSRKVKVSYSYFGSTKYHPEQQWLMRGIDLDKEEERIFAMKDMKNVQPLHKILQGQTEVSKYDNY